MGLKLSVPNARSPNSVRRSIGNLNDAVETLWTAVYGKPVYTDEWQEVHNDDDEEVRTALGEPFTVGEYLRSTTEDACESRTNTEVLADVGLNHLTLTTDEIAQLENIDTTTISTAQWSNLASVDQALDTTASPQFAGLTISDGGSILCAGAAGLTIGASATDKLGFFGQRPIARQTLASVSVGASYQIANTDDADVAWDRLQVSVSNMEADCATLMSKYNEVLGVLTRLGLAY